MMQLCKKYLCFAFLCWCCAVSLPAQTEADFATNNVNRCTGDEFQFFIITTDTVQDISWYFPGGQPDSSNLFAPRVTYADTGYFDVVLALTTNTSSYLIKKEAYIYVDRYRPSPRFTKEISGRTVTYTSDDPHGEMLIWEFGDGQNSSEPHPVHTFEEDGIYVTRLLSTNSCGTDSWADVIVIGDPSPEVHTTANDAQEKYTGPFRPGSNLGYFPPWTDRELADIAAGNDDLGIPGAGCRAIRPLLSEEFLEFWGYDIRLDAYQHFSTLGLEDNTVIVGFPSDEHRDTTYYCPEHRSTLFANMYTPIWDNGEHGTPVNDSNYLALYLYRLIHLYGDQITFYEIWNEPGFDYTFTTGYLEPGFDGNWWENDPNPCDYKLRAPIYHYIRTLRISYEIIKRFDPRAKVTLGSVGYGAFLDAILRNTDNPIDGSPTTDYPLGGGAYFDVVTLHSYPHFDGTLRYYDNDIMGFRYERHTDKAISGVPRVRDVFDDVLEQYGYDDSTYLSKQYTITECAVPRKEFGEFIGGEDVQINYIMKVYVEAVIAEMLQLHIYDLAESFGLNNAVSEFQVMGLYQRLFGLFPYNYTINLQGIAYKTVSDALYSDTYEPMQSAALHPPDSIRAEAFLDKEGHYTYVLWAKTSIDRSEAATATFSFPSTIVDQPLERIFWDHSQTHFKDTIAPTDIPLTGRPLLLRELNPSVAVPPTARMEEEIASGCGPYQLQFSDQSLGQAIEWRWTFEGGNPAESFDQHPVVTYPQAGTFDVQLWVSNAQGSDSLHLHDLIEVYNGPPEADFAVSIFDMVGTFENQSVNAESYEWDLGDFNTSTAFNPTNTYPVPGLYTARLIAHNPCGSDTAYQEVIIGGDAFPPLPNFNSDRVEGCAPFTVQYFNQSSSNTDSVSWIFQGGTPSVSSEWNPVVTYDTPGTYFTQITARNEAGALSDFRVNYMTVTNGDYPEASFSMSIQDGGLLELVNQSSDANAFQWFTGDGTAFNTTDFSHSYTQSGTYEVMLVAYNTCGTDTLEQEVDILLPSTAQFSSNASSTCVGDSISFMNQSIDATALSWHFEGGVPATSTLPNPVIIYSQSGTYDVQLIAKNASGEDTLLLEDYIQADPLAIADFTIAQQNGPLIEFNNTSQFATAYSWFFGNGSMSLESNPTHQYSDEGTYLVLLVAENLCGSDSLSMQVEVTLPPQSFFEVFPDTGCRPFEVTFQSQSLYADSLVWTFEGGIPETSTLSNPIVSYDLPGIYDVQLIAANGIGADTLVEEDAIQVLPDPAAQFSFTLSNDTLQCANQSAFGDSYFWDFGDQVTSTDFEPQHVYIEEGTYTVTLVTSNSCGSDTATQQITVVITDLERSADQAPVFSIAPNPSRGRIYLRARQTASSPHTLVIQDINGRTCWRSTFDPASPQWTEEINLDMLPAGLYLIQLWEASRLIWRDRLVVE